MCERNVNEEYSRTRKENGDGGRILVGLMLLAVGVEVDDAVGADTDPMGAC